MSPDLNLLLSQLPYLVPPMLVVLVLGALALARRDHGAWWKLVLAGCAALVASTVWDVMANQLVLSLGLPHRSLFWLIAVPSVLLRAAGLALLGAGALVGRRQQAPVPR